MPDFDENYLNNDVQNTDGNADQTLVKNASYAVEYAEDGVFLNVDYEDAGGIPIQPAVLSYDLSRRNIAGADIGGPLLRIRRHEELIRIADAQPEPPSDTTVYLTIPRDEMSAKMVLLPPCGAGRDLDADELLA